MGVGDRTDDDGVRRVLVEPEGDPDLVRGRGPLRHDGRQIGAVGGLLGGHAARAGDTDRCREQHGRGGAA